MASKGQKFRSYSAELKQTILKEYFDGIETPTSLSLKYDVPYKTVKNWIARYNVTRGLKYFNLEFSSVKPYF